MMSLVFQAIFILLLSLTSASVVLTSVSEQICVGSFASFECNVTGNRLTWRYDGGSVAGFTNVFNPPQNVGPYSTELVFNENGILVSIANTTDLVTSSLNGTTIECFNSSSVTSTTVSKSLTLDVKNSLPVTHITRRIFKRNSDIVIEFKWEGDTCVPMYGYRIGQGPIVNTTMTEFEYFVSDDDNSIMFTVISYDYHGQVVGSLTVNVCFSFPSFYVRRFSNYDSNTLLILIEDTSNCTVANTSCSISLTDSFSGNMTLKLCTLGRVIEFNGIIIGRNYMYNVNTSNGFRSYNRNGTIEISAPPVSTAAVISTLFQTVVATSPVLSPAEPSFSHISPLSGIIIGVVIVLLIFSVLWIVLSLFARSRSDNWFWSFILCDCFKGNENETRTVPLGRPESPSEEVKQTVSEM